MKKIWALGLVLLALDRFAKAWAQMSLRASGDIVLLPGVLSLSYAQNTGAAFSAFSGNGLLLGIVSMVMIAIVFAVCMRAHGLPTLARSGLLLIVLGGVSNAFDRFVFGYVVDYIELLFVRFAIFNVADIMVCVGAGLTALSLLTCPKERG